MLSYYLNLKAFQTPHVTSWATSTLDILKKESHHQTGTFLHYMYYNALFPLINEPTMVTEKTATLTNHIFTNHFSVSHNLFQAILATDLSDHFIVFQIWDKNSHKHNEDEYQFIRVINERTKCKFCETIDNTDWSVLDK